MEIIQAILAFFVTIFIIVGIHEYGHYLAARACKVKTVRFCIGIGKPIVSFIDRNETEWGIAPLPLGGYLQMVQTVKDAEDLGIDPARSFDGSPKWQRSIIVAAGPFANFVLALALFFWAGLYGTESLRARIGEVLPGTVGADAGFKAGDEIIAVENRRKLLWTEVYEEIFLAVANRDLLVQVTNNAGSSQERELALKQLPPSVIEGNVIETIGLLPDRSYLSVVLEHVVPDSPADLAGLQIGDAIIGIDDEPVKTWQQIVTKIKKSAGVEMEFIVLRGEQQLKLVGIPEQVGEDDTSRGRLGISPKVDQAKFDELYLRTSMTFPSAVVDSWRRMTETIWLTYRFIGNLVIRELSTDSISGPIGIANYAGRAVEFGFHSFLVFMAYVSISLGVFNLLPIPILDGGYLLQYATEGLIRRKLPDQILSIARFVGLCCIAILFCFAIYNDLT